MVTTSNPVDLHSHSTYSDGVLDPIDVAKRAANNQVKLWSLTDHDEVSGLDEAEKTATDLGMTFIPGVEISSSWGGKTVHIVGLGIDRHNQQLIDGLARIRNQRLGRGKKIAAKLEQLGVENAYEGAIKYASNPRLVSRTHFARYLLEAGYCENMQEVFNRYLGDDKPGNVRIHWSTLEEAVSWILAAGGRAVIAHPGRYTFNKMQADAFFDEFIQLGGTAIEVLTGSHRPEQCNYYADVARKYGFLASTGSDFHAPKESRIDLGGLPPLPDDLTPVWHDWFESA